MGSKYFIWSTVIIVFLLISVFLLFLFAKQLPKLIETSPIFQVLIQVNITLLGFYLTIMTYLIKKSEDLSKEYNNASRPLELRINNYIEKNKLILGTINAFKKIPYKTPTFTGS